MKLTLEELEAEDPNDSDQLELNLGDGIVVALPNPKDVPIAQLVDFDPDNPGQVLRAMMGEDGFEQLMSHPRMTARRLEQLFIKYQQHYGLPMPGESGASPRRSNGTARRSKPTSASQRRGKAS